MTKLTKEQIKAETHRVSEEYRLLREQYIERARATIQKIFNNIFEEFPTLEKFSWTQYTQYFNDGDTCYFYTHWDYDLETQFEGDDVARPESGYDKEVGQHHVDAGKYIIEFLDGLPSEFYQEIFGDHVKVVISRDKDPITEGYTDHD